MDTQHLLDLLDRKVMMGAEVETKVPGMKAYIKIIPIEKENTSIYKTNLMPVIAYEVRYFLHRDIYTEWAWGLDYDLVLNDTTTRIKQTVVPRTDGNEALRQALSPYQLIGDGFCKITSYCSLDSALVDSPIECYLEDQQSLPHLWLEDMDQ